MGYYAIASFRDGNNNSVGARVFDAETGKLLDVTNNDLYNFIVKNGNIHNVEIKNNKLNWFQGKESRYPGIYRDGHISDPNKTTIVEVSTGENRKFNMVSADGRHAIISEEQAINIGKQFGFTNCKVSYKDNKAFIQSINGEIPEMKNKLAFRMLYSQYLYVTFPKDGSLTTLEIPERVGGESTEYINSIIVEPKEALVHIKRVIVPPNIKNVYRDMFSGLPYIEEVEFKAKYIYTDRNLFEGLQRLRKVSVNELPYPSSGLFANCVNLKELDINIWNNITRDSFKNCKSLDINAVLKRVSAKSLYGGCLSGINVERLVLPETVEYIEEGTFMNMPNLKEVVILSSVFRSGIVDLRDLFFSSKQLMEKPDSCIPPKVKLYIKEVSNFCRDLQGGNINNEYNIEYEIKAMTQKEKSMSAKAAMLGVIELDSYGNVSDTQSLKRLFKYSKPEEIKNLIINRVKGSLNMPSQNCSLGPYNIDIAMPYADYTMLKRIKDVYTLSNCIIIRTSRGAWIIPLEKNDVIQLLDKYNSGFRAYLPVLNIDDAGKIDEVSISDDYETFKVRFRNKVEKTYDIDDALEY